MDAVDADEANKRLMDEYGGAAVMGAAATFPSGGSGIQQHVSTGGVPQQAGATAVVPATPLDTAMETNALIQALQQGEDPNAAFARFQQRRAAPSPAAMTGPRAPTPAFHVHQQVLGSPTPGASGRNTPANVTQVVQQAIAALPPQGHHQAGVPPAAPMQVHNPPTTTAAQPPPGPTGQDTAPPPPNASPPGGAQLTGDPARENASIPPRSAERPGSLAAAATRLGPRIHDPAYINAEIQFQFEARGSPSKQNEVREGILASSSLEYSAFWYIASKEKSTTLEILHSSTKYFHSEVAVNLRGAMLGFVGDRSPRMKPICVKLQQQKAFGWSEVAIPDDRGSISAFYEADQANETKFFSPPPGTASTNVQLPNLCILPMSLMGWATAKKRTLQEARRHIEQLDQAQPAAGAQVNWVPILEWLAAASIDDSSGNGRLTVDHALVQNTEERFHVWQDERLNVLLGPIAHQDSPEGNMHQGMTAQGAFHPVVTRLLETASNTLQVVQQSSAANAAAANTPSKPSASSSSAGHQLEEWELTALAAYSHVDHPRHLKPIWLVFQSTKNVNSQSAALAAAMRGFAAQNNLEIEENLFFPDEWMKRIVKVEFGTGSARADYSSLGYGLDIMPFLGWSDKEIRAFTRRQKAEAKTVGTRTLDEELQIAERGPRPPPSTYDELLLAWTTTYVALQVLIGERSPLTENFRLGRELLKSSAVVAEKRAFNKKTKLCRELIFHANDDMTHYFFQRKTPGFFSQSNPNRTYPYSLLQELFPHMQWMKEVNRPNFPWQWELSAEGRGTNEPSVQQQIQTALEAQSREMTKQLSGLRSALGGATKGTPTPPGAAGPSTPSLGKHPRVKREPFTLTEVHEGLRDCLKSYHAKFDGRVLWKDFCTYGNYSHDRFPTLEKYRDAQGNSTICSTDVMGRCPQGTSCTRTHVPHEELPPQFIRAVIDTLKPAVDYCTAHIEPHSASKRRSLSRGRGGGGAGSSR